MADCVDPKLMELIARNVVFKLINEHTLQSGLRSCDSTCTWLSHESRVATCDQLDAAIAGVDIGDTIEGFTYDPDTGLLTIDTDQGNFYVTLPIPEANTDTYPVSLVLGADYVLSLTLNNGTILTTSFQPLADMVQAFTDRFLRMVGYNASTHTMTFEIGNDSGSGVQTFTVNLSDLIPITVAADVCLDGDGTEASPLSLDIDCLVQRIVELAPSMALHLGDGCGLTGSGTAADPLCIDPAVIARVDDLGGAAFLDVGTTAGTVAAGDDSRLSDARTPTAHTHPLSALTQSGATTNQVPQWDGSAWVPATGGDVVGPASSTNSHIALFDGITGKLLKDGGVSTADFATAAQGTTADTALQPADGLAALDSAAASKLSGIASGATVGADWNTNVSNKPALGTAAAKNVPASGDAAAGEVVLGNDSRLGGGGGGGSPSVRSASGSAGGGSTYVYMGNAASGTLDSAGAWTITRLTVDGGGGLTATKHATTNPTSVWNDYASLTYT